MPTYHERASHARLCYTFSRLILSSMLLWCAFCFYDVSWWHYWCWMLNMCRIPGNLKLWWVFVHLMSTVIKLGHSHTFGMEIKTFITDNKYTYEFTYLLEDSFAAFYIWTTLLLYLTYLALLLWLTYLALMFWLTYLALLLSLTYLTRLCLPAFNCFLLASNSG